MTIYQYILLLLCLLSFIYATICGDIYGDEPAYAKITTGKIRGYKAKPHTFGHNVNVFKGIPFAEPPVGHRRFHRPVPAKPWFGTYDATYYRPACPSNTSRTTSPQNVTSEDCLYLNILADETCAIKKDCSVLVILHGGAFIYDSAVMENLTFLADHYASKDMIIVIPAYRIGIFGFLDIGVKHLVDKNVGFHDIVHGLKWIQNEIHHFGGDSDKVTLYGNSGGASIISLLSVSPNVEKMWDKIILSGPKTNMKKNTNREASVTMLKLTNCWTKDDTNETMSPIDQLKCLNNYTTNDLIDLQRIADDDGIVFHGPEVDDYFFYGQTYTQLLDEFKPTTALLGSTLNEFHVNADAIERKCQSFLPVFDYYSNEVQDACTDYYISQYDNETNSEITADAMRSDLYRIATVNTRKLAPTFVYSFELDGYDYHADDARFMIGLHTMLNVSKWKENYMLKYMPKMMERFIKYGIPDDDWPIFNKGKNYKVIDVNDVSGSIREPYSVKQKYFPNSLKTWLIDLKEIDDTVKYDYLMNKTKQELKQYKEIQEIKWKRFTEKWNEIKENIKQGYEKYKEKKLNATIEEYKKFEKIQQEKKAIQDFKIQQFINYMLSNSLDNVLEKLDEAEELIGYKNKDQYNELELMKKHIKDIQYELFKESLSPLDKAKYELENRIKKAVKDTINDYIHEKKSKTSDNDDGGITDDNPVTEFNFIDPKLKLSDELTLEELNAAKTIFDEQRLALEKQNNETYQSEKDKWDKVKDEINKKINESIEERKKLKDEALQKWNQTMEAKKEKRKEIKQKINETITHIKEKKNEAKEKIKEKIKAKIDDKMNNPVVSELSLDDIAEMKQKRNETIQKIKEAKAELKGEIQDAKARIEKDRPSFDEKMNETWSEARQALEAFKNATHDLIIERLEEKKEWKLFWKDVKNRTFSQIFDEMKKVAQEKLEKKKEEKQKFLDYLDKLKDKTINDFAEKIVEKELGLFQGSFVALPPELQTSGGVSPEVADMIDAKIENQRIWSAFWIVVIIAFLLAFSLFAKSCFSLIRPRPKGYFYNEDPGFFNFDEKSRIVVANYPTYT